MSTTSVLGFSPWRRRSSSLTIPQSSRQDEDAASLAPPQNDDQATGSRGLSISIGSAPGHRAPIRSFIHGSMRDDLSPVDSAQETRDIREDTAELASYLLSDGKSQANRSLLRRTRRSSHGTFDASRSDLDLAGDGIRTTHSIPAIPESHLPEEEASTNESEGPSMLSNLLKNPPPTPATDDKGPVHAISPLDTAGPSRAEGQSQPQHETAENVLATEYTPLLRTITPSNDIHRRSSSDDLEGQKVQLTGHWLPGLAERSRAVETRIRQSMTAAFNPALWNRKVIWEQAVVGPVSLLPAVAVGLLLNILDALSYGMILFPLGEAIFSHLGSAGISIYYVSTIVSQLTFSSGSVFRGAVGSELIEVVPFFHNMALKITDTVGKENPEAVIATTIVAYALSSMMTGLVFYLMGRFKFGFMVGFIPRHILIGCIGGVGWFLVATGFEVSARLEGSLEYNLDTLQQLTRPECLPLWICPLFLAIVLFWGQAKITSKYFLPLYILAIPVIFYLFVVTIDSLDTDTLRDSGLIFEGPPPGEPWWYFYTLYQFKLVRWDAIIETVPAMFALTFFGILHVPINVPALALNCGEDNANLDRELKLHGYSNFLSGCLGSIQNYLVYANTVFFMRSGGDSRLAGYMLAALTFGVMLIGPSLIGYIPVMMVGTLIFDLGFELLLEAVWLPRKKLKLAEYATVIVIVLVMGIYDFVIGIGVGIILAFVSLIVQTSRISAVRTAYSGDIVTSTVRRNPSQHHYLQQVGQQIFILKLTGYLFFGTVVSVEQKIRALLEDNAFARQPLKFMVLDLWHVSGLDYSAGEAFNTISRLLNNKGVVLVLSGVDPESQLGRNLRAVGLGSGEIQVTMLPNLNSALESCENELLRTLYARQEELSSTQQPETESLDVPAAKSSSVPTLEPVASPRRSRLVEAARAALSDIEIRRPTRWQSFKEPLRLMLQIFQGVSDKNEDFWFPATRYFKRQQYSAGTIIFQRGEQATGFYLVESGIIRAEYDLPQGSLCESIVAGTTCGELPFFSETQRTATAQVEKECVVWLMDRDRWTKLQADEPGIARELLRISLKLTTERMTAITSYTLTMAG